MIKGSIGHLKSFMPFEILHAKGFQAAIVPEFKSNRQSYSSSEIEFSQSNMLVPMDVHNDPRFKSVQTRTNRYKTCKFRKRICSCSRIFRLWRITAKTSIERAGPRKDMQRLVNSSTSMTCGDLLRRQLLRPKTAETTCFKIYKL